MTLTTVDTIPNGCTMIERAFVYVATDGTYYMQVIPSPGGTDGDQTLYHSETAVQLEAGDA